MSFNLGKTSHEVIYFIEDNKVTKEMEYGEFEAVLDGVVSETEFAGDECQAVFAKLDTRLNILSAVFFLSNSIATAPLNSVGTCPLSS